ncbi:MAG: M1 family metallopeptidase [Pseudomonadota bacterium]
MKSAHLSLKRIAGLAAPFFFVACAGEQENADGVSGEANASSPVAAESTASDAKASPADFVSAWDERRAENRPDPFTYANYDTVRVSNVDLDLTVSFDDKVMRGSAELDLEYIEPGADKIILDTNDLAISVVEAWMDGAWAPTAFSLGANAPLLGAPLEVTLEGAPEKIRVTYETSPEAEGLQWLTPAQTAGKEHPFLFSQFQPLYARTMAPLQDTPAVRITYSARIRTPEALTAIMSASQDEGPRDGDYTFEMPQAIPSYLLAIAVGDIEFKAINDHIGVYAERDILDAAVAEFEDTPLMEEANARLYGPYRWGRYDMIVLPPSFPFGGMENPRLSFLTPTLIAGDKSLTNVVAHELAHSWSGNLVTNATWRDAWLNEGFTSYVENRIMEDLYGDERATMERTLDLASLKRDVAEAARPELTALKMPVDLAHPDDAFSQVAYAGGMFFLKFLEERFGRETFDPFIKSYFDEFAFKSIGTEDFLAFFEQNLWAQNPDAVTKEEIDAWIYEPGLPETLTEPTSDAFDKVSMQQTAWLGGGDVGGIETSQWTTHEWLHFINTLPEDLSLDHFAALDARFGLSEAQNAEIANVWYLKAIAGGYEPALAPLEAFLIRVGRGKFIYRLYQTLIDNDRRDWAARVYQTARPGYHPIAQKRIDEIFEPAE